jgi:hypothetical protein
MKRKIEVDGIKYPRKVVEKVVKFSWGGTGQLLGDELAIFAALKDPREENRVFAQLDK